MKVQIYKLAIRSTNFDMDSMNQSPSPDSNVKVVVQTSPKTTFIIT